MNKQEPIRTVKCSTWDQYILEVRKTPRFTSQDGKESGIGMMIYRGHSEPDWNLSSTLERNLLASTQKDNKRIPWLYKRTYDELLNRFKRFAKGMPGFVEDDDLMIWAMGRHFGLLSPYLDWTESPYIAAFYAFEHLYKKHQQGIWEYRTKPEKGTVYIWGLVNSSEFAVENEFEILVPPISYGSRIAAQRAVFTFLLSENHLDIQSYLESRGMASSLVRYELSNECAMDAFTDFDHMNINYFTLYPDMFGASLHANVDSTAFAIAQSDMVKLSEKTE